ncbi:methyltransferase domain-containing protein [Gammaproteobacteria bacterium]|nr:methyltransferase domain-containing protein [Gammaproteobacteria bacterium]
MSENQTVDHYDTHYSNFATDLYAAIRKEAFGEDIGQTGWLTADEQDDFISRLDVGSGDTLLDIACGSGGPTLRIAAKTGSNVVGIDINEQGIEAARKQAKDLRLTGQAKFEVVDGSNALQFEENSFSGLICVDAVNHLPRREVFFSDWYRVLEPGGSLVFTDPIIITGPLTNEEIRIRSSFAFFLFVPRGVDERLLEDAGFEVKTIEDKTENMAIMARNWLNARDRYSSELIKVEGEESFSETQTFFKVAANISEERRLSRFAFHAVKPSE